MALRAAMADKLLPSRTILCRQDILQHSTLSITAAGLCGMYISVGPWIEALAWPSSNCTAHEAQCSHCRIHRAPRRASASKGCLIVTVLQA